MNPWPSAVAPTNHGVGTSREGAAVAVLASPSASYWDMDWFADEPPVPIFTNTRPLSVSHTRPQEERTFVHSPCATICAAISASAADNDAILLLFERVAADSRQRSSTGQVEKGEGGYEPYLT